MPATVTIRDVAKHAGVGVGTVSRVLNDSESVRESTRYKVIEAIEALDYSPNPVAQRLSRGRTMALGVVVPFFTSASVVKRLQGIVSVLAGSDYDLVLFDVQNTENKEVLLTNIARRRLVDGLLILSLRPADNDLENFLETGVPGVIVDASHPNLTNVIVDNIAGARLATNHLIDLGHERIAFISDYADDPFNPAPVHDRLQGHREAMREAGLPLRQAYFRQGSVDSREASGLARELLTLEEPPTAIFAYSDMQAIGVLDAARELGFRVPEDLSVVGYDDIDAAEYVQLTTVRQSLFESGAMGAQLLLEAMGPNHLQPRQVLLPTELVIRGTTAPPPEEK